MLSYRHAYHAGNHADVLKHLVLLQIAEYMAEKPAPFWIIDTHAGAGCYALESSHANKLGEYRDGIGRLWDKKGLPTAAVNYLEFVKMLNPDGQLRHYPGSPWLASQSLRESDRLRLYELHSTDVELLKQNFKDGGRQITVTAGDGFVGLKAILPPPPRRALVLIDPSYETRDDYVNVVKGLQDSAETFCDRNLCTVVSDAGKNRVAQIAGQAETPGRDELAQCHAGGQRSAQRRLRHERQRPVHHQPALVAGKNAA
jgi:23S rRNA (adenine2030-N6)-methyltransferase